MTRPQDAQARISRILEDAATYLQHEDAANVLTDAGRWRLYENLMVYAKSLRAIVENPATVVLLLRGKLAAPLRDLGVPERDLASVVDSTFGPLVGPVLLAHQAAEDARRGAERAPGPQEADISGATVLCMADVVRERVEWLWPGRVPRGKLVLLDGDPDLGKTTIALDLAARLSRGLSMPGETAGREPMNVLLMMAEDGAGDTIKPRLEAAGADLSRVFLFAQVETRDGAGRLPMLPEDGDRIREAVARKRAGALFLDPLFAFVSRDCNIFRDQDVRRALQPLVRVGEDLDCTCVVLRHLNKTPSGNALYRGGGSIGIIGAARSAMLVAPDPDDAERRILAVTKCNLGRKGAALAYRLVPEMDSARVRWEGPTEHTPHDLLATPDAEDDGGRRREAEEFLREALAGGPRPAHELQREAEDLGIRRRTLWRAKGRLGVRARKEGRPGDTGQRWLWELPDQDPEGCQESPKAAA